jgi:uncharacterized protein
VETFCPKILASLILLAAPACGGPATNPPGAPAVSQSETSEFLEAVRRGDETVALALLARRPELRDVRNENGVSPPLSALYQGRPEFAARLLAGREADVFEAAALGDVARLRARVGADPGALRHTSPDGFTALHLAAYFGKEEAAQVLLAAGADAAAVASNASGVRPLHSACATGREPDAAGRLAVARRLLEAGAPVDATQRGGFTALHSRALHGDVAFVRLLLAHGADPARAADDGRTPLAMAQGAGHAEVASVLASRASKPGS